MAAQLVTIWWRDIPTQVNAQSGRTRYQAAFPRRFQRAVDEAAMAAGLTQASDYVAEWRRDAVPLTRRDHAGRAASSRGRCRRGLRTQVLRRLGLTAIARNLRVRSGRDAVTCRVVFTPSGLTGDVEPGTTVLDAARQLGVDLDSVCGGRGICGHCQVVPGDRGVREMGDATRTATAVSRRSLPRNATRDRARRSPPGPASAASPRSSPTP